MAVPMASLHILAPPQTCAPSLPSFYATHLPQTHTHRSTFSGAKTHISPLTKKLTTATRASSVTEKEDSPPSPSSSSSSMSAIMDELEREQEEEEAEAPKHERFGPGLADRWREIAGGSDWAGLLDPMEPLLRSELIRYGEMAQMCYDAFDFDVYSKYYGSCKYDRRNFFANLGFASCGYDVTRYIYATSNINLPNFLGKTVGTKAWSDKATWIGFIAVSSDEATAKLGRRDIAVAWRGTVTKLEWITDLTNYLRSVSTDGIPCDDPEVSVQSGFLDLYTDKDPECRFCKYSAREQVLAEVRRLVHLHTAKGEEVSVTITGHSLGSALATLSSFDIAATKANVGANNVPSPVCVYSFSGPRVGNYRFKERLEKEHRVKTLRVLNVHDTVPKVPGLLVNERVPPAVMRLAQNVVPWWCYMHVGVPLELDHMKSPFLRETKDPVNSHNMEAQLHLLDGYHGKGERFVLATGRDPSLVNKASDFLKDHHLVPPNWRQDANRGMVWKDGRWMQRERPKIDHDHDPEMIYHLEQMGVGRN